MKVDQVIMLLARRNQVLQFQLILQNDVIYY